MSRDSKARKKLTRREQRDLDIEIGFLEGVVQRDPKYVEALELLGEDYTRREKFGEGLKIDEELARMRPDDPQTFYNLACSYALTKKVPRAIAALTRAIELGYSNFKWLVKDPDLEPVRRHPLFKKVQGKIRSTKIRIR